MFEEIYGKSPYQSPTDMGVNMAGFCICDDEVCRQASVQEIIRRYFATRTRYYQELCGIEELNKQSLLMKQIGVEETDRQAVKAARQKEEQCGVYAGAMQLADGTLITGRTSNFMGPSAAILMNSLKFLASIEDDKLLIQPEAFTPIQHLKTTYLGSLNPRLHSDEVLIALSLSAQNDPDAAKALEQLKKLKGTQAHITCNMSDVDLQVFNSLGIQVTFEPEKR
jgi:uncharacterized protein (UPF0371 family)